MESFSSQKAGLYQHKFPCYLWKEKHIDDDVWKTHIQTWKSTTHENFKKSEGIGRGKTRTSNDPESSHLQSSFLHCDAHSCTCFHCFQTISIIAHISHPNRHILLVIRRKAHMDEHSLGYKAEVKTLDMADDAQGTIKRFIQAIFITVHSCIRSGGLFLMKD